MAETGGFKRIPVQFWNMEDVLEWVAFVARICRVRIEDVGLHRFLDVRGRELLGLARPHLLRLSPLIGNALYEDLARRMAVAKKRTSSTSRTGGAPAQWSETERSRREAARLPSAPLPGPAKPKRRRLPIQQITMGPLDVEEPTKKQNVPASLAQEHKLTQGHILPQGPELLQPDLASVSASVQLIAAYMASVAAQSNAGLAFP